MSRIELWSKFLDRNLKNFDFRDSTNQKIDQCVELIREGHDLKGVEKALSMGKRETAIIFELAHSRINIREKFENWNRLWMDQYLASYSTPEIVCRYRASRISDFNILEAGSGAGMQGIFLSTSNLSTVSVEIQPERYRMARLNALEYKTGHIKFVNGDIYNLSDEVGIDDSTVIFSDPARPRTEGERSMSALIPSPETLVKVFGKKTANFVFDLPPQMRQENMGINGEKEYISINGKLNRLTLYTGKLAKSETSAVMLPQNMRIAGEPGELKDDPNVQLKECILVPDISLVYARLLWKLKENYDLQLSWKDARRYIMTSQEPQENFPGEQFYILWTGEFQKLKSSLREHDAGKVVLRYPMEDGEYYKVRNDLEKGLNGNIDLYVFRNGKTYVIARKVQKKP